MRVLALFSNENGEARQAVVALTLGGIPYELGLTDPAFLSNNAPGKIADELGAEYNAGGGLALVALEGDGERPDVVDENGSEVPCEHYEVDLG